MPIPGDQVSVSVLVEVPQPDAFRIFTEEINAWWRGGLRFRAGGHGHSLVCMEPKLGGRLFEEVQRKSSPRVIVRGEVSVWQPPSRLVFSWHPENFSKDEDTEVEVTFAASASGTLVTVVHRGWSKIRADHPVRHGQDQRAFIVGMSRWWGDLMSSLRALCTPDP